MLDKIKKEIDEMMTKKGNIRGDVLRDHFIYLEKKEGDGSIKKMEDILDEIGYPLKFSEIDALRWYPDAYCGLILVILKEQFNWTDKDIYDMGKMAVKYSFIVAKLLLRYLISVEMLLTTASKQWKKHLDFGELEVVSFKKEKKEIVLRVKNYDIHPLTCIYQKGYYVGLFKYTIKTEKISIEERKCIYRGDDYHEYVIRWE